MTMLSPPSDSEPTCKISRNLVVSTQDQNVSNKLAESFIIDSGATIHVCNDFDRFYDYHELNDNSKVKIGDTFTRAVGYGQVKIHATPVEGAEPVEITLRDVAYIPRFGCNVVSLDLIMENGYAWDSTSGLILRSERPVCRVERHHRMFTLEYKEAMHQVHAAIARRSHRRPENKSSTEVWHQRMGHANFEAIRHLPDSAEGVKIVRNPHDEDTLQRYETCRLSKAKKQISRVPLVVDAIPRQTTTLHRSNEPAMKILDFDQSDSEEEDQVLDRILQQNRLSRVVKSNIHQQ